MKEGGGSVVAALWWRHCGTKGVCQPGSGVAVKGTAAGRAPGEAATRNKWEPRASGVVVQTKLAE